MQRTSVAFWTSFRPHRAVSSGLGISATLHLAVFLIIGSAMYSSGEDDADVPELSVQLVSRDGPNDPEFTDAALPKPAPEPVKEVLDDPGTSEQTVDAETVTSAMPVREVTPDAEVTEETEARFETPAEVGAVLATTAPSSDVVPLVTEPSVKAAIAEIPQPEKQMLTRNVEHLAQKLLDTNMTDTELTWQEDGKQYSARVMRQPAPDSTGIEQVVAEVMTDKDGKRMKTHLSLKRLAFSHFTQLINNWDRNIALHDDVIDGRFHSNSEFSFVATKDASPRFFGKVTTSASTLTYGGFNRRRDKEVFQGGYETKTEKVVLPRDMPDVVTGGNEKTRRVFSDDTRIIFNSDGSYAWRNANGEGELHREESSQEPRYLIGEKGAKLYVRGTVAGLFTVYTPNDIEIEDDLVYVKDPRQTVLSRDFLALIAGRDVCIAAPEVTGPGDLTVHGAIFARRRFYIELTDRGRSGDATLVIYGSLTAGTLSETEPRYATKVDYDKRFEYLRPASFPMTRRYEVEAWDQDWQEVERDDLPAGLAQAQ
ncbi:MAG TPA: hypothetical protein VM146_19670 [Steroidobacteraceae bacterium]|nr:hypothetical protein [Steroidobacteraceae bacterium]